MMTRPDRNYLSIADVDGKIIHDLRIDPSHEGHNPLDFDDILKFSHARNVQAQRLFVAGGRENAIDLNRGCENVVVENTLLEAGRQASVVIKGGCRNITLRHVAITNVTGWCDVLIGDWSDQSWEKTTEVHLLHVSRNDGQPVRVVVGHADWPEVMGGNVRILRRPSYALKCYWWAKYLWVRFFRRQTPPAPHR